MPTHDSVRHGCAPRDSWEAITRSAVLRVFGRRARGLNHGIQADAVMRDRGNT